MIEGLEALYEQQPWNPSQGMCEDPYDSGFRFHGAFDGVVEVEVAEALYRLVRDLRPEACAETGTADGYTAAFIARALEDNASGRLWTCELDPARSTGAPRPWPALWEGLGLEGRITACLGDSRLAETWNQPVGPDGARSGDPLPEALDFILIDSEHSFEVVMGEWAVLGARLRAGGALALHDTRLEEYPGVRQALAVIQEQLAGRGVVREELPSARGLSVLRLAGAAARPASPAPPPHSSAPAPARKRAPAKKKAAKKSPKAKKGGKAPKTHSRPS